MTLKIYAEKKLGLNMPPAGRQVCGWVQQRIACSNVSLATVGF